MFKFLLAACAATLMAFGGGDIAPIQEPVTTVTKTSPFYVGATYTYIDVNEFDLDTYKFEDSAATFVAGYDLLKNVGIEGRYTTTFDSINSYAYNIYIKPQMNITDDIKVYALVGYGNTVVDSKSAISGVGYGGGLSYDVTSNVFAFVDYTSIHDTNNKSYADDIGNANIGVAYRF